MREAGGAEERLLDVDPAEQAVAELADDRQRLPADAPAEHQHRDPRRAGQLRGDPQPVGDDGQLAPAAARLELARHGERRRARVHDDALAVVDERSRAGAPIAVLLVLLESLADVERELRAVAVDGEIAPPCVRTTRRSASSATRSLRMVTVETPNCVGEVAHAGAAVLLDEADDVLLAFAGEDIARDRGAPSGRSLPLLVADPGRDTVSEAVVRLAHLRPNENAMSRKQIEINRNLWHAVARPDTGRAEPGPSRRRRSRDRRTTPPPPASAAPGRPTSERRGAPTIDRDGRPRDRQPTGDGGTT